MAPRVQKLVNLASNSRLAQRYKHKNVGNIKTAAGHDGAPVDGFLYPGAGWAVAAAPALPPAPAGGAVGDLDLNLDYLGAPAAPAPAAAAAAAAAVAVDVDVMGPPPQAGAGGPPAPFGGELFAMGLADVVEDVGAIGLPPPPAGAAAAAAAAIDLPPLQAGAGGPPGLGGVLGLGAVVDAVNMNSFEQLKALVEHELQYVHDLSAPDQEMPEWLRGDAANRARNHCKTPEQTHFTLMAVANEIGRQLGVVEKALKLAHEHFAIDMGGFAKAGFERAQDGRKVRLQQHLDEEVRLHLSYIIAMYMRGQSAVPSDEELREKARANDEKHKREAAAAMAAAAAAGGRRGKKARKEVETVLAPDEDAYSVYAREMARRIAPVPVLLEIVRACSEPMIVQDIRDYNHGWGVPALKGSGEIKRMTPAKLEIVVRGRVFSESYKREASVAKEMYCRIMRLLFNDSAKLKPRAGRPPVCGPLPQGGAAYASSGAISLIHGRRRGEHVTSGVLQGFHQAVVRARAGSDPMRTRTDDYVTRAFIEEIERSSDANKLVADKAVAFAVAQGKTYYHGNASVKFHDDVLFGRFKTLQPEAQHIKAAVGAARLWKRWRAEYPEDEAVLPDGVFLYRADEDIRVEEERRLELPVLPAGSRGGSDLFPGEVREKLPWE